MGTAGRNREPVLGEAGHSGACPPAVCAHTSGRSVRTRSGRRPLLCSLTASCHLWASRGAEGAAEMGRGMEGGRAGPGVVQEPSRRGRKRHFSLGWCSWSRPWPQEASGPAWLRLRRWAVTEDPGGGGQVGTWQHPQGRAGLGGSAQALHTARSSGWASAELPGCLLKSDAVAA